MRFAFLAAAVLLGGAGAADAGPRVRSYITMNGGVGILTGNVDGDVLDSRATGLVELGIGYQVADRSLVEFTYGWMGQHQQEGLIEPLPAEGTLWPEEVRAFRVSLNSLLWRWHFAPSGQRTGYLKPAFSLGAGFYQVSRLLRSVASVPPFDTSQLVPVLEVGAAALVVFSRNSMGYVGARFTVTDREPIVDATDHLDGFGLLLGFRAFLPSPREAAEP